MIRIENVEVFGWEAAIRGMRNPMNSWDKSDSTFGPDGFVIGEEDLRLARSLAKAGSDHRKFLRQVFVSMDIVAPLYWWKEFDTYKVGTVANSCSTMHKIHAKEFTLDDFSHEHLDRWSIRVLENVISLLNHNREMFVNYGRYEGGQAEQKISVVANDSVVAVQLQPETHGDDELRSVDEHVQRTGRAQAG